MLVLAKHTVLSLSHMQLIELRGWQGFKYQSWSRCDFVTFVDITTNRGQVRPIWFRLQLHGSRIQVKNLDVADGYLKPWGLVMHKDTLRKFP